jgi:hypothetical protein
VPMLPGDCAHVTGRLCPCYRETVPMLLGDCAHVTRRLCPCYRETVPMLLGDCAHVTGMDAVNLYCCLEQVTWNLLAWCATHAESHTELLT